MSLQPIIKLLTTSGSGSRRQMADAIKHGRVALNGKPVESFIQPVNAERDVVTLDGKRVSFQLKPRVYLILNKPKGIVSTTSSDREEETIISILPARYQRTRLYPVGRLDKESTGLVLLTNDGEVTFRLTHPRFEHEKEYLIQVESNLKPDDRNKLESGLELEEGMTSPARIRAVKCPPYNYSITIHEGRKRQVRRMFASLGYRVLELKRVRLGNLKIGDLAEGQTRELTIEEVRGLRKKEANKANKRR